MEGERQDAPIAEAANEKPIRGDKLRVFVSYSRKDDAFAQELVTGLELTGFQPYLDKHDIAAGEEWETRLGRLIEAADTVVFVISPDAVASERCAWEVKRTTELKKRLLPIVWRAVPEAEVPPRLKQLNYIFFDKPHSFAPSLAALATALRTDLDWIREHTRLGEAALRWQERGRSEALLLRGDELIAAKTWLKAQPQYAPEPPLLTHEFIKASEDNEVARENATRRALEERAHLLSETETAQARTARLQKRAQWALAIIAALVVIGIGAVSWQQTRVSREHEANLTLQASLDKSGRELLNNQHELKHQQANLRAQIASIELLRGNIDSALRFSTAGARFDLTLPPGMVIASPAAAELAAAVSLTDWRLMLRGHEGIVFSAAFSPDGTRIVTASADGTARIWDAATGNEIKVLRGHESSVNSAAFSPDGRRIVTASADNTARIWDAATGNEIKVLRGHGIDVNSAAFSPDGTRIVTAAGELFSTQDNTARIWDALFATMSTKGLLVEACARLLVGLSKLNRDDMRLLGYSDDQPEIDVCEGVQ
jgi:hypothetical protein